MFVDRTVKSEKKSRDLVTKSVKNIECWRQVYSLYHVIPDGNFATCPILARTTTGKHRKMWKEVVNTGVALNASVTPFSNTETEHKTRFPIHKHTNISFHIERITRITPPPFRIRFLRPQMMNVLNFRHLLTYNLLPYIWSKIILPLHHLASDAVKRLCKMEVLYLFTE